MAKLIWPQSFINKIICRDCLEVMKEMPAKSIDMAITSPPYWGLRDYGNEQIFGGDKNCEHEWEINISNWDNRHAISLAKHGKDNLGSKETNFERKKTSNICQKCQAWKGQLGLEPTPEMYIEHLTEIFNELKRVLKKEGTLWLNIGDTYGNKTMGEFSSSTSFTKRIGGTNVYLDRDSGVVSKCLSMIPERLAWSLIQNGWILRNKIIWYKPNAMPSSVTDRFSNRWEYIFLFSKSQRYYFDLDAVREPTFSKEGKASKAKGYDKFATKHSNTKRINQDTIRKWNPDGKNPGDVLEAGVETRTMGAIIGSGGGVKVPGGKGWTGHPRGGGAACQKDPRWCPPERKNPGDFFEINTQSFPEAHFAVFPEKLCEKPIKAGCPEEVCKKCGKAKEKIIKAEGGAIGKSWHDHKDDLQRGNRAINEAKGGHGYHRIFLGYESCNCNAGFEGGIVLDPFAGAGTALYVAKQLRRRFIGIDIKQEYCDICEKRLAQGVL